MRKIMVAAVILFAAAWAIAGMKQMVDLGSIRSQNDCRMSLMITTDEAGVKRAMLFIADEHRVNTVLAELHPDHLDQLVLLAQQAKAELAKKQP